MKKKILTFAGLAFAAAIVRFFLKGILDPLGVPTLIGSLLASITIVLVIATGYIFDAEGRCPNGRYLHAAGWFVLLAVWCQILIIGGILASEQFHATTYYQGPWEMIHERFPTAVEHAMGHVGGFFVLTALLLMIGGVVYWNAQRRQRQGDRT